MTRRSKLNLARALPEVVADLTRLLDSQHSRAISRRQDEPRVMTTVPEPSPELLEELEMLGYGEGGLNEGMPANP